MITAHLAVLKAGKFSLGLDPAASDTRLDHLLNDSQATLIVTDAEAAPVAHHCMKPEQQLIHMDDINSNTSEENLDLAISPCAYSYLRYTSGSTGQAKGGLKTHRHVMHAVMNATNYFHICANDRLVLLTRDTCFGKYAFEVLLNGASLCPFYIQEEGLLHLIDWLIQEEITIYHSFSTVFRSPYIAPRTAIERELWRIWTEVLDLEQIGVYDNFFDLGGSFAGRHPGLALLSLLGRDHHHAIRTGSTIY